MQAERSATEQDMLDRLWQRITIEPVAVLDYLRTTVLNINAKRCPKWRFRLAPDTVIQLQPRPSIDEYGRKSSRLFEGLMLHGELIEREHFESRKARLRLDLLDIPFEIRDDHGWMLKLGSQA